MRDQANESATVYRWGLICLAVAGLVLVSSCAGFRLHDASKAEIASSTRQKLFESDIAGTVDASLANARKFLEESERIAGLEASVRKERALLDIAESGRSMASWLERRRAEQAELGFDSTAAAHASLQANVTIESQLATAEENRRGMAAFANDPAVARLLVGPACAGIDADSVPPVTEKLTPFNAGIFNNRYEVYRAACVNLAAARAAIPAGAESTGAIGRAREARVAAEQARADLRAKIDEAKGRLAAARSELKMAAAAEQPDLAELRDKAGNVAEAAAEVSAVSQKLGLESVPLEKIEDIAVILAAASSGEVDKAAVEGNDRLAKASLAAAELPSLAEDALRLLAAGDAPPTNHLILALNHQQILYARAVELSNLWQEELGLHDQKIAALREQAHQYREIQYRLCNYATIKASAPHQGEACAHLAFENDGALCRIGPVGDAVELTECQLAKSWRENYSGSNTPRAKRQLLAALLAYSRALDAQAEVRKIDFQMINVGHKRIIASDRAAVAAWNNLVTVPVDTLDAYYAAGVKPDTIVTALAQLLGLLGIGVGIGVSN